MKFLEISILLLIIQNSFQDDCTYKDGKCTKAQNATFENDEKICDLNPTNDGCILRNVECKDFTSSALFCSSAKLPRKHKICFYDSDRTPSCYEEFEECFFVKEQNNCNGYSPNKLTKCVWDASSGECKVTTCEATDKNNCGSYTPVDTSMECSLDGATNICKEISRPNNNALQLKFSLFLFISLILLNYDII